jgi:hypothetical protein
LPFILHPAAWPALRNDLVGYGALLARVYRALDRVTEGQIIVDAMKLPGHVYLASTLPGLDVRVAHLTRDPRGYAYSKTKWIPRQGAAPGAYRTRRRPHKSAIKWSWCNMAFEALASAGTPTVSLRYEDLVHEPARTLSRVAWVAGVTLSDNALRFVGNGEVELVTQHIAAGSRGRMATGLTPLVDDDAWEGSLSPADRRTVEALTWPVRLRYGYRTVG